MLLLVPSSFTQASTAISIPLSQGFQVLRDESCCSLMPFDLMAAKA
jgi:hypothetical protein